MSPHGVPKDDEMREEVIPKGTVKSRIRRLHRLAENGPSSPPSPVPIRERDSERSGWGAKRGVQARFIQPATHSKALELGLAGSNQLLPSGFQHALPPEYPNNEDSDPPSTRTVTIVPGSIAGRRPKDMLGCYLSVSSDTTAPPTELQAVSSQQWPASPGSENSSGARQESDTPSPTSRRVAARALFDRYGISRPSG